jgi:hypothetical protein
MPELTVADGDARSNGAHVSMKPSFFQIMPELSAKSPGKKTEYWAAPPTSGASGRLFQARSAFRAVAENREVKKFDFCALSQARCGGFDLLAVPANPQNPQNGGSLDEIVQLFENNDVACGFPDFFKRLS